MRIFVTGSIAYDYIMVFPGRFRDHILADKMHVLSVSFLVDSLTRRRGGTAANIAYNLALLGEKPGAGGHRRRRLRRLPPVAREPRASTPRARQGDRRRAHGVLLHQHRPPGQPDHRVLPRRDGQGVDRLAPRTSGRRPTTWCIIAPNDPAAMARYAAECTGGGHSLPVRPVDAASADGQGRARGRLQGRQDPGRQRLRVRHDGREAGHLRVRPAPRACRSPS